MRQVTPSFYHCTSPIFLMTTVIFIMIWKALVLAMSVIDFHYYIWCHSFSTPNLRSALVAWFFPFAFNTVCDSTSVSLLSAFFVVSIFLMATLSLIWDHVLLRSFSVHFSVSGYFNNKWYSLSSPTHKRHLPFSVPTLLASFSFQNSSRNHAVSRLYSIVNAQLVNKAFDIQQIIKNPLKLRKVTLLMLLRQLESTKYSSPC